MRTNFLNKVWSTIRRSWIGPLVQDRSLILMSHDIIRHFKFVKTEAGLVMAQSLLGDERMIVRGADYEGHGKRWLAPVSTAAIAVTGTNSVVFNVFDWFVVKGIGFIWTIAGQTSAMSMDFDIHDRLFAANLLTDKLDGTNGYVTGTVANQAVGKRWHKEIGDLASVTVRPGYSINANVTATATTTGSGMPYVVGEPTPESPLNDTNYVAST